MFNIIFTAVLALIILMFAGLGLLAGRKRVWFISLAHLGATVAAAIGSFFLSKLVSKPIGSITYDLLMEHLPSDITVYANDIASAPQIFSALIAVILAPVLFIAIFSVAKIVIAIITVAPKKFRQLKTKGASFAGMACGFVCGIIIFAAFSIPAFGLFAIVNDVTVAVSDAFDDDPTYATVAEITDASVNNPISKTISTVYGDKLFEELTTADMGEHELSLTNEIDLLTTVGNALISVSNEEITPEEAAEDIREVAPVFESSSIIPTVVPELLTSANECWEKGEDFHGIEKIDAGSSQPIVEPLIDTLVDSNYDSIKKDASTIIEILAILVENDVIDSVKADPKSIMENEDLTSSVIFNLLDNDHFTSVVEGIAKFGIQFLGDQLHFHAHKDALYDEFIASANETIPQALANGVDAKETVSELFDNFGLDVSKDSISAVAEKLTASNVTAVLTTEELTLNNEKKITLSSPDALAENSMLICTDQIAVNMSNIDDKAAESKALAKAIHEIMSISSIISSGDIADSNSIQKIGPILDALSSTRTIGERSTEYIIIGLFQSDLVHDSIGLSLVDATDIAQTICEKSHTNGYAPILKSVSDTVEVIKLVNSEESTKEEFNQKVGTLISELTPETTEVLQMITTKEVIEKRGVRAESSENVSNLISNVLGNLSTAKEEGMSDEQYEKEAAATSNLLNVALSANNSNKDKIFADPNGEESSSAISMTASEYVNSVLDSEVISNTMVDTVYDENGNINENPLNMSGKLSEEDNAGVISALEERWANATEEEKANEEYVKKYTAIGHIINVPLEVVDGELVHVTVA